MPCPVMVALRCRAMGQIPIYDQLRNEQVNAEVSPSAIPPHHLAHPSRHFLGEEPPSAAVVEVRPVRRETEDLAGHQWRVWAYPAAGLTGDEPRTGNEEAFPGAASTEAGVPTAPRHARSDCCDGQQLLDRKSTRLNSSHSQISYAVFCLK